MHGGCTLSMPMCTIPPLASLCPPCILAHCTPQTFCLHPPSLSCVPHMPAIPWPSVQAALFLNVLSVHVAVHVIVMSWSCPHLMSPCPHHWPSPMLLSDQATMAATGMRPAPWPHACADHLTHHHLSHLHPHCNTYWLCVTQPGVDI